MTKLKNEQKACPTRPLRVRAWIWQVVQVICQGQPRPSFAALDIPLMNAISNLKGKNKTAAAAILPPDSMISASRWQGWWTGQYHPKPPYVGLMELVAPGSSRILNPQLHPQPNDPYVMQLLFALDRLGDATADEHALFEIVRAVSERWRPRRVAHGRVPRWGVSALPGYAVPPDAFLTAFRVLEPSSIIHFMLHLAGGAPLTKDPLVLQRWAFDLVAAALATDALLRQQGPEAIGQGGCTEEALMRILFMFLSYMRTPARLPSVSALGRAVKRQLRAGACLESPPVIPETPKTLATLQAGVEAFQGVLAEAGLTGLVIDTAGQELPKALAAQRWYVMPNGCALRWAC
jgi:hypothetical protein